MPRSKRQAPQSQQTNEQTASPSPLKERQEEREGGRAADHTPEEEQALPEKPMEEGEPTSRGKPEVIAMKGRLSHPSHNMQWCQRSERHFCWRCGGTAKSQPPAKLQEECKGWPVSRSQGYALLALREGVEPGQVAWPHVLHALGVELRRAAAGALAAETPETDCQAHPAGRSPPAALRMPQCKNPVPLRGCT